jgi:N-acetylglucosaminyl-diphospho-decaprenol L-rhamnosyltransferase
VTERPSDLAVVVVNYNAGEHLLNCLSSLFTAGGDATLEVVVVDNASADGSVERAEGEHSTVRFIRNPDNRGFSAGVNQGVAATTAPFVFLLNPDAEITSGTVSGLVKIAEDRPRVAAVGPLIRNPDDTVYSSGRKFPTIMEGLGHAFFEPFWPNNPFSRSYKLAEWDRSNEREVDWVSMACMLLRRSALQDVGLLDEHFFLYAEELDLCTRLKAAGWKVLFTPEVEVVHEGGVSTGLSRRMALEHSKSIYRYFAKHRARGWRRALLPFAWLALRVRAELVSRRRRAG